jgi:hypothetical protein
MTDEKQSPVASHRDKSLIEKFKDKFYRDSYVASHTRRFLARQMRKFRGEKSQAEFGELINKRQTVVSRLEDPKYGKWTLQTLFEVASKLDVAVIVRFVDFSTFMKLTSDMSDEASRPVPYDQIDLSSFQTTINTSYAATYTLLPFNLPASEFQFFGGQAVLQQQLNRPAFFNLALGRQSNPTAHVKAKPIELIENLMTNRQQNPIADTPRIGSIQ